MVCNIEEDGFEGHQWWMVYTPYFSGDSSIENPILCFADTNEPVPPHDWKRYCRVCQKPTDGYNSDPVLLYHDHQLYVAWRENITTNKNNYGYVRATFIGKVGDKKVDRLPNPILWVTDDEEDTETCPILMHDKSGRLICYGMHLRFHSKFVNCLTPSLRSIVRKLLFVTDVLGFFSEQKHYGIAIWHGDNDLSRPFHYIKTESFLNCNKLYRPWHMDFFDAGEVRYAVIQTNQSNADVVLASSVDGEHFHLFRKPLVTNKTIGKLGIYKPCAGVTPSGLFYLYFTAQDKNCRSLNKLYLTVMPFRDLLEKVR